MKLPRILFFRGGNRNIDTRKSAFLSIYWIVYPAYFQEQELGDYDYKHFFE